MRAKREATDKSREAAEAEIARLETDLADVRNKLAARDTGDLERLDSLFGAAKDYVYFTSRTLTYDSREQIDAVRATVENW